jgi:hypothetical protein
MKSQTKSIREDLQIGRKITPMDALKKYGCFRLGARINDLRNEGMHIVTNIIKKNGKRFAQYSLINR